MSGTSAATGVFRRELLPDAPTYFEQQGLILVGRGKQRHAPCPIHGGSDSLSVNVETGCWFCFSCGAKGGDMLDLHRQVHGMDFIRAAQDLGAWQDSQGVEPAAARAPAKAAPRPTAAPVTHETLSDYAQTLWSACRPLCGPARSYLVSRRCVLPPGDGDLRCHPALKHPLSGYTGPALVGLVTDAVTRKPISLHRTWIKADGAKADVVPPRLVLGQHRKQGGVIRLWPDEAVTYGLAVAEGIETALSIAHAYTPAWACIDAGNLAVLPVLGGLETLLIGADNDAAGQRGATDCARRWADAGVEVLVTQQAQNDVNDSIREAA
jgi:putative DNA primase/helicase